MNKFEAPLRGKFLFLLIPTLVGTVYLGSTVLSSSGKKDTRIVKVDNYTQSCELTNVQRHKDHIRVTVQNNSNTGITEFVLTSRIDPRTVFTEKVDFAFSELEGGDAIPPGGGYDYVIYPPGTLNQQPEIALNLSAVIYQDGSSEGDPKAIRDAMDYRLGQKIQIMKILPVLDKLSRLSEAELGDYWGQAVRQDFGVALNAPDRSLLIKLNKKPLSNDEPDNESEQFKSGAKGEKESVFYKYQDLTDGLKRHGAPFLRERIVELKRLYTKIVSQP